MSESQQAWLNPSKFPNFNFNWLDSPTILTLHIYSIPSIMMHGSSGGHKGRGEVLQDAWTPAQFQISHVLIYFFKLIWEFFLFFIFGNWPMQPFLYV